MSKAIKEVKVKAIKESEKIFMKNRPDMAMKDGSYPKVDETNSNTLYGREAMRTQNQVVKTRVAQYKASKPRTAEQIFKGIDKGFKFIKRKKI